MSNSSIYFILLDFFLEIFISLIQLNEKNRQMSSSSTMSTLPTTATNSTTTVDGAASTIAVKSPTDEKQIPIGKFFGKIFYAKVPAGFVPGSVACVKDEELKTDPFRVMGMVNEIAIESNVISMMHIGSCDPFRIRYHGRVYRVICNAGFMAGSMWNVDGKEYDLNKI
jgi:hypothetical protein